ncbi:MAG TPA: serine/threonine-protein kinase, partial [Candidatus Eisenbacteria bacterium]|nr:serine/threonine-protein kinase [Candidatus Eisenbacteria bacterium]
MDGRDILHYRMVRALGTGASGEAWLARDLRLHRDVVLKFIADAHGADRRTWLEEEARSLAALAHPGIATVHALENDGATSFLVTEYIDGETLRELLGLGPLPVPEVMSMALALADALRHAHARAVVHRDIKPENIVVDVEGEAHLVDFGIAALASRAGASAPGVYGTDGYMSPEQARGEPADPRSDVYAFGVVMVEMLAGARPRDLPVPVPQALRARGVPAPLVRVVTRCLSASRARRYRDGGALFAALDGAAVAMGLR